MRIAMVSAHYPPNFVSGGTLIPQRLAEGLAARGHEVHVFAGELDRSQPDMRSWSEITDSGVVVHWTTVNSMIDWAAQDNFANPRLDARFAGFLAEVRPDVVHLHSLQAMGGGLVTVAKAAGIPVVVTMHDAWWWCARQFLADRRLRPCSPVVACGVCACERDNDWLRHRDDALAAPLALVDLVLAPSATMMELFAANGVDPDRLELDENHTLDEQSCADIVVERTESPLVRFVYAGGPHPLKGADVVVAAAAELADLSGWRLDLVNMAVPEGLPEAVGSVPGYRASDAVTTLADYDVLLMPSVATESYSMITREALAAGLVVLTGDNPGPTEVVRHGQNGLVVPRADPAALARAMRSLVTDRALLDRLRPGVGKVHRRTLTDQLDGLEQRYHRLIATRAAADDVRAVTAASPIRRVLLLTGIGTAPLRYRGRLPQEALAGLGVWMDVRHYRDVEVPALARDCDALVLYRVPATEQILDLVDMVRRRPEPVPVLFDIDDLVFDPDVEPELADVLAHLSAEDRATYWQGVRRYRTTLETCDGYIGSTEYLVDEVSRLTGMPAYRFANGVGIKLARASDAAFRRPRRPGPPRIGYLSGTSTHNEDWAYVEPAVLAVMRRHPEAELHLVGLLDPSSSLQEVADRVHQISLRPWYELPAILRDLDVNLAPLAPGRRFNEAKSAIKWLEAALVGTATVASPTQPFREAIEDGRTGLLAQTERDWQDAIERLVADPGLADGIGLAARNQALLTLPPARQGRRYLQILQSARAQVAEHGHRQIFRDWTPEYLSEPYLPIAPDDYYLPDEVVAEEPYEEPVTTRTVGRILADYRNTALDQLRTQGLRPTATKAARVLARMPTRVAGRLQRR